ncbi:MAG: chorismate-binding protein [Flavobacteriales bacterium]|jgi:isochorismate synthase|nr:chorismate-binding protein [Flavobacteriales bacterium]MBK7940400.1 chorismate-binding protein [Flavobacteriales bacterium]MBK8950126.1 chorismate-binding protein [Flavobacteriales bacterium]MBK9699440.1 chorismate-binding protein [Flavobacteriales bacterium]
MSTTSPLHQALSLCLDRRITFAAFRVPGGPVTLWAQRNPELEPIDPAYLGRLNEAFLVAPFTYEPQATHFVRNDVELTFGELPVSLEPLHGCEGAPPITRTRPHDADRPGYEDLVRSAKTAIAEGTLDKVVASRTVTMPLDRSELATLFEDALDRMPHAFVALLNTPEHGTWLGASPERLLTAEDELVRLDALAGTRPRSDAPALAEEWSPKERREQALVTREIVGQLIELGLPRITLHGPRPVEAGGVSHLRTEVEADLGNRSLDEVLVAVHPTPAVCGTPRPAANAFIAGHEGPERGLYTGFWGPWNADGRTEIFVNIRCMEAFDDAVALHVGAGVTDGSDPEAEWRETEAKAAAWTAAIRSLHSARVSSPAR